MYWVLQNNLYSEEGFERLTSALERLSLPFSIHKVVPFIGALDPDPEKLDNPVIVMGSYSLARFAHQRGWRPGAYLDNLDFEIQRRRWDGHMLNQDAIIVSFGEVAFQENPFFIRPVLDTKAFTGTVMDWGTFSEWQANVFALTPEDNPTITYRTKVMVCRKKEIYTETRTWIVDGKVVTASGYKIGTIKRYTNPEEVEPRIIDFAQEMANKWCPNQAFVLDVADTPDGLRICEINNLNSAGFYKSDVAKLIMALETMEA